MRQPFVPPVTCPNCGARVIVRWVRRLECFHCGAVLGINDWYGTVVYVVSLALTLGVLYVTGIPPSNASFLLALVLFVVLMFIAMRWYPPAIDVISTPTSVLGLGPPNAGPGAQSAAPVFEKPVNVGRPMFQHRRHPFTLEAVGVVIMLAALAGWRLWAQVEPMVVSIWPNFRAEREAGPGFPATIRIGETALQVSNGSDVGWSCDVSVGNAPRYRTAVGVRAGGTSDVPYRDFLARQASGSDQTLRALARDVVRLACLEPGGRGHLWTFD